MTISINNRVGLAIVDNGAYKTVMDTWVVEWYGLKVGRAVAGNCGKSGVPDSGVELD